MNIFNFFKKPIEETYYVQPDEVQANKLYKVLEKKIPIQAVEYCVYLWNEQPFSFTLSKTRSSCFGNYSFKNGKHKITINHDLNPSAFLITYIHEVAHQRAWLQKSKKRIVPHGKEWKQAFQGLMKPLLTESVFPNTVLEPLKAYMQNPAASSVSFAPLAKALRGDEENMTDGGILLAEIAQNTVFVFRDKKFIKLERRRTRVLCLETSSQKRYTILATARVYLE